VNVKVTDVLSVEMTLRSLTVPGVVVAAAVMAAPTLMLPSPVMLPLVALMIALPSPAPVTRPSESTVAIDGLLVAQMTVRETGRFLLSRSVAIARVVSPTAIAVELKLTLIVTMRA